VLRMYGVEMRVPSGKLPGFYAQVIHKIGDHVNVFDRDGQLLIVPDQGEQTKLTEILAKANMLGESFPLYLLPAGAEIPDLADYGFTSQDGHSFLYADQVSLFCLDESSGAADDRWAAMEQWKEHLVGKLETENPPLCIIDKNREELIDRIARSYRVAVRWIHPDS
jgi:hypothetical protein